MEDLYKDDPNSWLWRAYFSKSVYRRPDPSQLPIIPLDELKLWHSEFNSNWAVTSKPVTRDNTSKTSQSTTMSTFKSNPNSSLTSEVPMGSNSKTSKTGPASKHKSLFEMLKEVKKTLRRQFVGRPSKERTGTKTVMSTSRPKKLKKCFDHEVRLVSAMEKYSEVY